MVALVDYRQQQLDAAVHLLKLQAGAASEADRAREKLAWACYELALIDHDSNAAGAQLALIRAIREANLHRIERLVATGAARDDELAFAQFRLANVRYREAVLKKLDEQVVRQLRIMTDLGAQQVLRLGPRVSQGTVTLTRQSELWCQVAYASYRLALVEGQSEKAVAVLKGSIDERAAVFERLDNVYRSGLGLANDRDYAHVALLKAGIRLAILQDNRTAVRQQLEELVLVLRQFLQRVETDRQMDFVRLKALSTELNVRLTFERYRLAMADGDLQLLLDDPAEELEWRMP